MSPIQFPDGIAIVISLVAFTAGVTLLLTYVGNASTLRREQPLTTVRFLTDSVEKLVCREGRPAV